MTVALGLLLLVAAGLKLYGLSVSPLPSVGWLSVPGVQLAVVAAEFVVGGWLLSGVAKPLAWLAAVVLFTTFAIVSGYLGVIGQARCGCFGAIEASPWAAFGVDVAALLALAVARPSRAAWRSASVGWVGVRTAKLVGGAAAVLAVLAASGTLVFGSLSAALAKLRGESLSAPAYVDFGAAKPGDKLEQLVAVRNWTARPVRLIGGTSDCSCVTTSAMPLSVPPGEAITLAIYLKVPASSPGDFTRLATLSTDCERQRTITFRLGCRVE